MTISFNLFIDPLDRIKSELKHLWVNLHSKYILHTELTKLSLAMRVAQNNHIQSRKVCDVTRKITNYVVLLEIPTIKRRYVIKKGKLMIKRTVKIKEKPYWLNLKNFKKIKRKGWLPKDWRIDQLRERAFYFSDLKRTYTEEQASKEVAKIRYIKYLKQKHNIPL